MYKRFRHILMLIILFSGALQALAQVAPPDTVCVGTNRKYWVAGFYGSVYTWKVDGNVQSTSADFLNYSWLTAGSFTIEAQEHKEGCNGDVQTIKVTVVERPQLDTPTDVSVCDSYTLPEISGKFLTGKKAYYDNSQALGGKKITATTITKTQPVWIYDPGTLTGCSDETKFQVTINNKPILDTPPPVFTCDSYTVPIIVTGKNITANAAYYDKSQVFGGKKITSAITSSQPVWIYDPGTLTGCSDETQFIVTIYNTPELDTPDEKTACDAFTLSSITGNHMSGKQAYYDNSQAAGGKLITGPITKTQPVWIYDPGMIAGCSNETSFKVNIFNTPILEQPLPVEACDSYTLPDIKGKNLTGNQDYYDNSQKLGGKRIPRTITSTQPVWIYDETKSSPACPDEKQFQVNIYKTPVIDMPKDAVVCDSYQLPGITGQNLSGNQSYYDDSHAGGGKKISGLLYESKKVWAYDENPLHPACFFENSFYVTINHTPEIKTPNDTIVCDSYTLPKIKGKSLTGHEAYYDNSHALGGKPITGPITSKQTLWIYDETATSPNCYAETSFKVNVYNTPKLATQPDVYECGAFKLPEIKGVNLSGNQAYYDNSQALGGKKITEATITKNQKVWIFDTSNAALGCKDETSFLVTIYSTPEIVQPNDTIVCDSYTLPGIKGKNLSGNQAYYDNSQALGGKKITGTTITKGLTVWIYDHNVTKADCKDEKSFKVDIYHTPEFKQPNDTVVCDSYALPQIAGKNITANAAYYNDSQFAGGKKITGPITSSGRVWIYGYDGPNADCYDEKNFYVTTNHSPLIDNPGPIVSCDSYELPQITGKNLSGNQAYYDNSKALGGKKITGTTITKGQTVWIYDETGTKPNCFYETSFLITILKRPIIDNPGNVEKCDSYTLPGITGVNLTSNKAYYDNSQALGGKKITNLTITSSKHVWIYDYTGPNGECNDEVDFQVTIYPTPKLDARKNTEACGVLDLSPIAITGTNLSGNAAYYDNSQALAGKIISVPITKTTKVWIFDTSNAALGCNSQTNFDVTIYPTPEIAQPNDTIVCDSYTLPKFKGKYLTANVAYYDNSQALGGKKITVTTITKGQTVWIYDPGSTPDCWDEKSFNVKIFYTPEIVNPGPIVKCDSYTLPKIKGNKLIGNEAYYDDSQAAGGKKIAGTTITSNQKVWIYASAGPNAECFDETSFEVTINNTPVFTNVGPVVSCDSYKLPTPITGKYLSGNQAYYTNLPALGGTKISGVQTKSQTVWIYDETGTTPNCPADTSFVLTIPKKPIISKPADQFACESYTLPLIIGSNVTSNKAYYDNSQALGGKKIIGSTITSPQRVWIYDYSGPNGECYDETSFNVTIYKKPKLDKPDDVNACSSYTLSIAAIKGQNLSGNQSYFDNSQILGGKKITAPITSTQKVWIYDNADPSLACGDEKFFMVNINPSASDITASVNSTPLKCFGKAEGTITVTNPLGGSGVYEYSINGTDWSNTTGVFTNLSAGSYAVQVRDANAKGCFVTVKTVFIAEPILLSVSVSSGNETYPGAGDGSIFLSDPRGGSGKFEFSIDGTSWQSSLTFSGLIPGKYDVLMRDANNITCSVNIKTVEILKGLSITALITPGPVSCFGGSDGSLTISKATGGSGSYEYSIDGEISWKTSGVFTGLKADDYSVSVRDATNPVNKAVIGIHHIDEPAILSASIAFTSETYADAGDGTITLSAATGGSGDYEYSIDGINWQLSGNFSNLKPQVYDIYIRDANTILCFKTLGQKEILSGKSLQADVVTSDATCFDDNDGTITISKVINGSGTYEFSSDGGATWKPSGVLTGLKAGDYAVMVRDALTPANKSSLGTWTISQPLQLNAKITPTTETFQGSKDGKIVLSNPVGGSGAYRYSINGTDWQTSGSFINLIPGIYDVYIMDANVPTCSVLLRKINLQTGVSLSADVNPHDVLCYGSATGSINFSNPAGGTGNYQFSINGGTTWSDKLIFNNLTAGKYYPMIRDKDIPVNNRSLGVITINQPIELKASISQGPAITITGGRTSLSAIVSGGSGGYTYLWNDPLKQTTATATNLRAGFYKLVVTDSNGCKSKEISWEITEPQYFPVVAEIIEPIACPGGTAIIRVTASGGIGPYSGTGDFTVSASADPYQYWVTDQGSGNLSPSNFILVQDPESLSATIEFADYSCHGTNDGTIVISNPKGGSGVYEYRVNGGTFIRFFANPTILNNLIAGVYSVELRDASQVIDCIREAGKGTISDPPLFTMKATGTNGKCHGEDGTISFEFTNVSDGIYNIVYDGGSFDNVDVLGNKATVLTPAGNYKNLKIEVKGCSSPDIVDVDLIDPLKITLAATGANSKCFGEKGSVNFTFTNVPNGSYTINYDGGKFDNVNVLNNKATVSASVGIYNNLKLTIGDCTTAEKVNITLTQPVEMTLTADKTDSKCFGDKGSIQFKFNNVPNGSYTINYDGGKFDNVVVSAKQAVVPAFAGTYNNLKVLANGCSSPAGVNITLSQPPILGDPVSKGDLKECEKSPIQLLDANTAIVPVNGITIIWYDAVTGGNVIGLPILNSIGTKTYYAEANNGICSSKSRTPVTLTIQPTPGTPVSTGNITECEKSPVQLLNANTAIVPVNGITIIWYDAMTGGNVVGLPILNKVGTITYYAEANNGICNSESRVPVTLTIQPTPAAPVSKGNLLECEKSPIQSLDANAAIVPVNGISIIWYDAVTGGNVIGSPILDKVGTKTYYAESYNGFCRNQTRTSVTLTIAPIPSIPVSKGDISECTKSPIQTLNANTAIIPVAGITLKWYNAAVGGTLVASPTLNTLSSKTYYAEAYNGICSSISRTPVKLTIAPIPANPVRTSNIVVCATNPIQTLNANTQIVPVNGNTFIWYDALTGGNVISSPTLNSVGTKTYYAEASNGICTSPSRTAVTLTIQPTPEVPVSLGDFTVCKTISAVTLNAVNAIVPQTGISITWYDRSVGGNMVTAPTLNTVGTRTYYALASNGLCVSPTRTPVTLTINPIPTTPVAKVAVAPTCNDMNGTVVVTNPSEGSGFEYSLSNNPYQASANFTTLKTGHYNIKVRNIITGCVSDTAGISVPAIPPAPVMVVLATQNCVCYDGTGSISFNITNAVDGVYIIKYDGGEFSNVTISKGKAKVAASAGIYNNLNMTNPATGCNSYDSKKVLNVIITQPKQIVINDSITQIDYKSGRKGVIKLQVSGGTGSYSFNWSNGETTKDIKNLVNGTYTVTVTDQSGCVAEKTIIMPPPNLPPVAVVDTFKSSCSVITGNLLANDSDPEKDPFFIDVVPITSPLHGSITLNADGTFEYKVNPRFDGIDSLKYAIYDSNHYQGDTATVILYIVLDTDHDGIADAKDLDADGDGILNVNEGYPGRDTDGDGIPDYLDIDSDGDGIVDNIEAQSTAKYIPPSYKDLNNNGVDDIYDTTQGGTEIIPVDTDGDGIPDFIDSDSDNDGVPDYIEGDDPNAVGRPVHFMVGKDSDFDGLDDAYDTVVNGCASFGNVTGSNVAMQDFDGDGIKDWRDDNDDNDMYLTKVEDLNGDGNFANDDLDYDGHPEYLDYGRDCDLFIPDAFSPNGDNIHDYFQIYCINHYPNAKMYIFDQLGNKIFEQSQYGNIDVWGSNERAWWNGKPNTGSASARDKMVPPGTYYYVLDLGNGEVKKSFVFVSY